MNPHVRDRSARLPKKMEDITAEYAVEQLAPGTELRFRPKVTIAAKTDLGRTRENNEDKFEFYLPDEENALATRGLVFLVCDGMGGHAAGQFASELACKTFIDVYLHHPASDPEIAMTSAVQAANRYVVDVGRSIPAKKGMGTTLTGLILIQDAAFLVHVGDSRGYRLRQGELLRLTDDHTWIEEAIREGVITEDERDYHPYKHVLTRAIGIEGDLKVDVDRLDLKPGDTFLLCSDGLINHVTDDAIGETLRTKSLAESAWSLVGQALQGGGSDNITVLIVRVDAVESVQTD